MASEMNKICICGHLEKKHGDLNKTVEQRLDALVRCGTLIPYYYPDRINADYSFSGENNVKVYTHQAVVDIIVNLRENYSSCKVKKLFGRCVCQNFKADNLKYLENLYEREASKIIH